MSGEDKGAVTNSKSDQLVSVGKVKWIYPHQQKPPSGKLFLLNEGNSATTGEWGNGFGWKAWQHLFDRDKVAEAQAAILEEERMSAIRPYRVPKSLPMEPTGWKLVVNAVWFDQDNIREVAHIYKMVDPEGYTTPICKQWDIREPVQFPTGYAIKNTIHCFATWGELVAFWDEYLAQEEDDARPHTSEAS